MNDRGPDPSEDDQMGPVVESILAGIRRGELAPRPGRLRGPIPRAGKSHPFRLPGDRSDGAEGEGRLGRDRRRGWGSGPGIPPVRPV